MDCPLIIYFIGAIENTIGEHIGNLRNNIGNLMRIHWEFEGKKKSWEQVKLKKKNPPLNPHPKLKK
jgi:hypothetical protein